MRRRRFLAALGGAVAAACAAPVATTATTSPSPTAAPSARPATSSPVPTPTPAAAKPTVAACERDAKGRILFVDTHAHLNGITASGDDYEGAAATSIEKDDANGVKVEIVMPPPFPKTWPSMYDYPSYQAVAKKRGSRVAFLGGGGTLDPLIQEATAAGSVTSELDSRFRAKAAEILAAGAIGFGELTAQHLSFNVNHPYVAAPADHPLFLMLADIAAAADVPIDLHMFPVRVDNMQMPGPIAQISPNNPRTLRENVAGFERLLSHNPKTRIVWDHIGDIFTGCGDPQLAGSLVNKHPNLYLQMRADLFNPPGQTLVTSSGAIDAGWLSLIKAFPDRIVVGGDNFWGAPGARAPFQLPPDNLPTLRSFIDQLPADIACRVAADNAVRIYRLA